MRKNIKIFIILTLFAIFSCEEKSINFSGIYDHSYFPLEVGFYRIYKVTQTTYKTGTPHTSQYQLKESIVDSFLNLAGGHTYVIHRQQFDKVLKKWKIKQVWSVRLDNNQIIQDEGNIQFLKINFPLDNNRKWDGNLYNTMSKQVYTIDSLGNTYYLDKKKKIKNTVKIIQKNIQDKIVETDYRTEKYAPKIGLIYKEINNLKYCTSNNDCLGKQQVLEGLVYKQTITSYGHE